ncbi:MAG TPA: hypothetical protein VG325_02380 [Solirubrobacteraceae bacterium]|jgi:hypothetical protein|nr:hypothetical protein [Solirubrobacteraceae bacterium]
MLSPEKIPEDGRGFHYETALYFAGPQHELEDLMRANARALFPGLRPPARE